MSWASSVPRTPLTGPNIDYPVLYGKYLNGLGRLPARPSSQKCAWVKLPFFNMLDELLKPTELGESLSPPRVPRLPGSPHSRPTKWPIRSIFWGASRAKGLRAGACPSQKTQGPTLSLELVGRHSCVTSYPRFQQLGSSRHFSFLKVTAREWPSWATWLLRRSWSMLPGAA